MSPTDMVGGGHEELRDRSHSYIFIRARVVYGGWMAYEFEPVWHLKPSLGLGMYGDKTRGLLNAPNRQVTIFWLQFDSIASPAGLVRTNDSRSRSSEWFVDQLAGIRVGRYNLRR